MTPLNPLQLSSSLPPAPQPRLRDPALPMPQIPDLSRLIADIRRARVLLDAAGELAEPATLERVSGGDPRD